MLIRQADGQTYTQESVACLGTSATILFSQGCTIPVATLLAAPYNLPWGSSIFATILATNAYGTSVQSDPGNGAIILTVPSMPSVSNDVANTNAQQITIVWVDPVQTGGTPILDYSI